MFDWVQVRWTGRPGHDCNSFLCQMIHHISCCMGSYVIPLKNNVLSHLLNKSVHMGVIISVMYCWACMLPLILTRCVLHVMLIPAHSIMLHPHVQSSFAGLYTRWTCLLVIVLNKWIWNKKTLLNLHQMLVLVLKFVLLWHWGYGDWKECCGVMSKWLHLTFTW